MTVLELIEKLKSIPPDYEVIVQGQGLSEGHWCDAAIAAKDDQQKVWVMEDEG